MISIKTCFAAEGISVDRDTGEVSAFNLLVNLDAPRYPVLVQRIAFFCLLERTSSDPDHCQAQFSLTLNDSELARQSIDIHFGATAYNRCTIRLEGFALEHTGVVVFRIAIAGHGNCEWVMPATLTAPGAHQERAASSESKKIWESAEFSTFVGTVNVRRP